MSAAAPPPPAEQRQARWRAAREILVVRLDNLGDLLMTTPALAAMRESLPGARLTLLASPSTAAVVGHVPLVDEVIAFAAPWTPAGRGDPAPAERELVAQLAERRFDAAVIFTVCTQSALPAALLCRLAGIPLRLAHARENPYGLLTDWVPDADVPATGMRHEVQRQLDLVRAVGLEGRSEQLSFRYGADEALAMRRRFVAAGGDLTRPYIVVHPGATASSRRYPAERFGLAADAIVQATGCQVVLVGAADEQALVDRARSAMREPGLSLAGALSLGELGALIAGAQVTLCNNSAPAHIAAALGAPVVVLYALTNPQHTPWKTPARVLSHDVPCRHCLKSVCLHEEHPCLTRVPSEAVADAALELIGTPPAVLLRRHRLHLQQQATGARA